MDLTDKTLKELLDDERIAPIAKDAIRDMDLNESDIYEKTLAQIREIGFGGELDRGFDRLFRAADTGEWYYPLYSEAEKEDMEDKRGANIVWFPSDDPKADERPYILVIPGGGWQNVWNLTEGWPVAEKFNRNGYHAFILTYRVLETKALLDEEMRDIAAAIRFIGDRQEKFHVDKDRYVTCGFSAGGYLTCLWSTEEKGWKRHGLPRPMAMIPVYPVTSMDMCIGRKPDVDNSARLFDRALSEIKTSPYETQEHCACFPPCALFLAAGDELVPPVHSYMLKEALDKCGVPCRLEVGPTGGHGFADGTGMCMEGWIDRASAWIAEVAR